MGKKERLANHRTAFVTLRDMPGTRVMFWVVEHCPYCGEQHAHLAGNLRSADPGETLGEHKAPCDPARTYLLELPPRPRKKKGKRSRRTDWEEPEIIWSGQSWDDEDEKE